MFRLFTELFGQEPERKRVSISKDPMDVGELIHIIESEQPEKIKFTWHKGDDVQAIVEKYEIVSPDDTQIRIAEVYPSYVWGTGLSDVKKGYKRVVIHGDSAYGGRGEYVLQEKK